MAIANETVPHWYVVHTYSGYENKVATNIEKIVENRNIGHLIFNVKVPVEKVVETNENNVTREVERKLSQLCSCQNDNER